VPICSPYPTCTISSSSTPPLSLGVMLQYWH
jgi:hypothetical protein